MKYTNIRVRFEDFISFQEKNGSYYLDKKNGYSIYSPSKSKILSLRFDSINEEIFEGTETIYSVSKDKNGYILLFKTIQNNEYRIDLINDKDDKDLYHIAFTLSNRDNYNYENETRLDESNEVFSRVIYILKDFDNKIGNPEYCIGATGNMKKDRIYEYMMKYIKGWEKRNTDSYHLGWGLFFRL
jgi:hypothetical protein